MIRGNASFLEHVKTNNWFPYLLKVLGIGLILLVVTKFSASLPPVVIFVLLALISIFSAIGAEYRVVVRKAVRQVKYRENGFFAKRNNGRTFSLIGCFVLSLVCTTSLIVQATRWQLIDWAIVFVSIFVFIGVCWLVQKRVEKEIRLPFQSEMTIKISYLIIAAVLATLYFVVLAPVGQYASAEKALEATVYPFAASKDVLISEVGKILGWSEGFLVFGISAASNVSWFLEQVIRAVLCASAFLGVANLLATCALQGNDLMHVFEPLETFLRPRQECAPNRSLTVAAIALCVAMPVATVGGLMWVDAEVNAFAKTPEYANYITFIEREKNAICYVLDIQKLEDTKKDLLETASLKKQDSIKKIEDAINEACDTQLENVNEYIDWYYRTFADFENFAQYIIHAGKDVARAEAAKAFDEKINKNVDTSKILAEYENYRSEIESLKSQYAAQLNEIGITNDLVDAGFIEKEMSSFDAVAGVLTIEKTLKDDASLLGGGGEGLLLQLKNTVVRDILQNPEDASISKEERKQKIIEAIEESRSAALNALKQSNET